MVNTIKIGCIGCGFIAGIHLANAVRMPGVQIRAVCDVNPGAARIAKERFGACYATDDSERLIADPDIKAILICTHAASHAELAIAAVRAGKHVFVEKPMATSAAEAHAMVDAAEDCHRWLAVDLKFRFADAIARVHSAIGSPLLLVGQAVMDPVPASAPHLLAGDLGIAADLAPHVFDTLMYLAHSEVQDLRATAVRDRQTGSRVAAVAGTLTFVSGAIASFVIGDSGEWQPVSKWFYEVTDGATRATVTDHCRRAIITGAIELDIAQHGLQPHEIGTRDALTDFLGAVREDRPPGVSGSDGLRTVILTDALGQALRTGDAVRVNYELSSQLASSAAHLDAVDDR